MEDYLVGSALLGLRLFNLEKEISISYSTHWVNICQCLNRQKNTISVLMEEVK